MRSICTVGNLRIIWNELTSRYTGNTSLVDELWTEIEKKYTTKNRHYHNLTHLEYMVEKSFEYKSRLTDYDLVLFSIFYHDIIYNTKRPDNEQKSADTAKERMTRLGVPTRKITHCQKQIQATKNHSHSSDNDTNYLLDFDLAILGESLDLYRTYSGNIRKEYSMFPDFLYNRGRKKVLQHFLSMDRIFKTDDFFDRYERQAKENLKTELLELS